MTKWEYLQLGWFYESNQRRYAVNGQFKHDWNNQALHTVLNQLGAEGWELVAAAPETREYVFKRELVS